MSQFVFEYANREMSEIGLWSEFPTDKEVAVGVVDVKAFHVETPEEIAAARAPGPPAHSRPAPVART